MFSPKISSFKQLFFLAAGMFVMGCEDYVFEGLLPYISTSLHTSVLAVAHGCAAFGIAYVASIALCAFLISKQPPRQVLMIALILFLIGNLTTFLANDFTIYIMGRFLAGLGSGLFLPVAVGAATQAVEPGFQGRALSLMWSSNSAGAVIGVPLGLWIAKHMGWRATVILFLVMATIVLFGIWLGDKPLRIETPPPKLRDQLRLLRDRQVLSVIGVTFLTATGCLGLYAYISQVLFESGNSSDLAFSLWSCGGIIGSIAIGYILDRTGQPRIIMIGILIILLITITSIPLLREIPVLGLLPFLIWGAMGWASVTPQQYSLIQLKPGHEAILVALNSSTVSFGGAMGTILGGMALNEGLKVSTLPFVTAIFVFVALMGQCFLIRK